MNNDIKSKKYPRKILLIQTAFLGDIVLTTPLIRSTKKYFPEAELDLLTTPVGKDLLEGLQDISKIIVYDKKGVHKGIKNFFKIVKRIKREDYDLSLSPHRSYRSTLMQYFSNIAMRIGFSNSAISSLYTVRVLRDTTLHDVERNLLLLKPFDKSNIELDKELYLPLSDEDRAYAQETLGQQEKGQLLVGVVPGAVWGTKRWLPEGFAKVVDELNKEYKAKVILFGSKDDAPIASEILRLCKGNPMNMAGKTTIRQLSALVSRCSLFITNDSGPMHIASAWKIPTVAIFGSTTLELGYCPYNNKHVVVQTDLECRPCGHHGPQKCPLGHFNCMKMVTPHDVMEGVKTLLT